MRINDINTQILVTRYGSAAKTREGELENRPDGGMDNVRLSPEAKGWMDALKAARDSDPVNLQKVEDISKRIAKGVYSVSAREVAESILEK
jgi:flagellar biosynthesis anti-sigma factor FlgM